MTPFTSTHLVYTARLTTWAIGYGTTMVQQDIYFDDLRLNYVYYSQFLYVMRIKMNYEGLEILSATLCHRNMDSRLLIRTCAKMCARDCQAPSAHWCRMEGENVYKGTSDRLIFRSYSDLPDEDTMAWHNFGYPFLKLAIRQHKTRPSQHLFACLHTCGISRINSTCIYRFI